jgi:hypothetical protein
MNDIIKYRIEIDLSMKKLLLIICILSVSAFARSQSRLGYSLDSLKAEFSSWRYHAKITKNERNITLEILTTVSRVLYICDPETEICQITIIYPYSQEVRESIANKYNQRYKIISPTQWRAAEDECIIYKIELQREVETDNICFIWTYVVIPTVKSSCGDELFYKNNSISGT